LRRDGDADGDGDGDADADADRHRHGRDVEGEPRICAGAASVSR
jgi:hypothetical protein